MGIQGLLKSLQPVLEHSAVSPEHHGGGDGGRTKQFNIRQFGGKVLAVDASSWLHKAAYATAERLVEYGATDAASRAIYTRYMVQRCEELLQHAKIARLIMVFDNGTERCPLKSVTNVQRDQRRDHHLSEARRLKRLTGHDKESQEHYLKCVRATHAMAQIVAQRLKHHTHVSCLFSPYEADAQLAKLCIDGHAHAVITEDSDILVYSAACHVPFPIIYKLDRDTGSCDVITMDWLLNPTNNNNNKSGDDTCTGSDNDPLALARCNLLPVQTNGGGKKGKKRAGAGAALLTTLRSLVTREKRNPGSGARLFVQACVLAGCDYAPSQLSGVGLVTAFKLMKEQAHREPTRRYHFILKSMARDKIVPPTPNHSSDSETSSTTEHFTTLLETYEELLAKSEAVFYYHHVIDISNGQIEPLLCPSATETAKIDATALVKDLNIKYRPCLKRFGSDVSFLGSSNNSDTLSLSSESTSTTNSGVDDIVPHDTSRTKPNSSLPTPAPTATEHQKKPIRVLYKRGGLFKKPILKTSITIHTPDTTKTSFKYAHNSILGTKRKRVESDTHMVQDDDTFLPQTKQSEQVTTTSANNPFAKWARTTSSKDVEGVEDRDIPIQLEDSLDSGDISKKRTNSMKHRRVTLESDDIQQNMNVPTFHLDQDRCAEFSDADKICDSLAHGKPHESDVNNTIDESGVQQNSNDSANTSKFFMTPKNTVRNNHDTIATVEDDEEDDDDEIPEAAFASTTTVSHIIKTGKENVDPENMKDDDVDLPEAAFGSGVLKSTLQGGRKHVDSRDGNGHGTFPLRRPLGNLLVCENESEHNRVDDDCVIVSDNSTVGASQMQSISQSPIVRNDKSKRNHGFQQNHQHHDASYRPPSRKHRFMTPLEHNPYRSLQNTAKKSNSLMAGFTRQRQLSSSFTNGHAHLNSSFRSKIKKKPSSSIASFFQPLNLKKPTADV